MTTRLKAFAGARPPEGAHAGLWLDKHIGKQERSETETRRKLVAEVAHLPEPAAYASFFRRWQETLSGWQAGRPNEELLLAHGRVRGRMAVGLGADGVLETSLRLHQTYGVPYIPGSALKGLARSYALKRLDGGSWGKDTPAFKIVFGLTPEFGDGEAESTARGFGAGYITFFDALYVPGSGVDHRALHVDVLAVHHKGYYEGGQAAPADWDSPTVVPFLSATGTYLIAVGGPAAWAACALQILTAALKEFGVGAKTSSGYGRMSVRSLSNGHEGAATVRQDAPVAVQGTETDVPPATAPLDWRKGRISKPGQVTDLDTNATFRFEQSNVQDKGWTPGKGAKVDYALSQQGGRQIVKIKRPA